MAGSTRPELVMGRQRNTVPTQLSFPSTPHPHSMLMLFKKYDFNNLNKGYDKKLTLASYNAEGGGREASEPVGQVREVTSIELPFPKQLLDSTAIKLNAAESGPITRSVAEFLSQGISSDKSISDLPALVAEFAQNQGLMLGGAFRNTDGKAFKEAMDSIQIKDVASAATFLLKSITPAIGNAVSQVTGQAVNPLETLVFSGVNLKQYSFNWELFPSNTQDSENIKQIIRHLKRNSLPEMQALGGGENEGATVDRLYLSYPSVVEIFLLGVDPTHFPQFKPAMISLIDVNYSPEAKPVIMKGGKPGSVLLTMTLQELNIDTAENYMDAPSTPATQQDADNPEETPAG